MKNDIEYYAIQFHTEGNVTQQPWTHDTLPGAIKAAERAIKAGAFKVEVFGYRADGTLYHRDPVRVRFGAGAGLREHVLAMTPRQLQKRY